MVFLSTKTSSALSILVTAVTTVSDAVNVRSSCPKAPLLRPVAKKRPFLHMEKFELPSQGSDNNMDLDYHSDSLLLSYPGADDLNGPNSKKLSTTSSESDESRKKENKSPGSYSLLSTNDGSTIYSDLNSFVSQRESDSESSDIDSNRDEKIVQIDLNDAGILPMSPDINNNPSGTNSPDLGLSCFDVDPMPFKFYPESSDCDSNIQYYSNCNPIPIRHSDLNFRLRSDSESDSGSTSDSIYRPGGVDFLDLFPSDLSSESFLQVSSDPNLSSTRAQSILSGHSHRSLDSESSPKRTVKVRHSSDHDESNTNTNRALRPHSVSEISNVSNISNCPKAPRLRPCAEPRLGSGFNESDFLLPVSALPLND